MNRQQLRRLGTVTLAAAVVVGLSPFVASVADAATDSVTVAGDLDSEIGCAGDWVPDCAAAHLTKTANGLFAGTFSIPAVNQPYQYKFATNDSWSNPNFGLHAGSGNVSLPLPAGGSTDVTFVFDPVSNLGSDSINSAAISGDFQTQLGCAANNDLSCPQSWLYDEDHDGIFNLVTGAISPGDHSVSAAALGSTTASAPVSFTVPSTGGGATTTITFDPAAGKPTVSVVPLVQPAPDVFTHPTAKRGDVVANLWEWNWKSIGNECRTVLGPAGYGAVQVAPPQNSINNQTSNPAVQHPWWEVYQPVDYSLNSRMGSEDDFKAMVAACRSSGVQVIVDTVINHMTGQGSTSYGGATGWTKYNYPGLYTPADFHTYPADCPQASNTIADFNDYLQVTKCELVGLSDLRTESDQVRSQIAGYLNKLLSYGVTGFRVDAAKHIGQADLAGIFSKLNRTVDGKRPYIALEVPPGGPGKLTPFAFQNQGNLLGFDFATQVKAAFTSNLTDLSMFGEDAGLLPSGKSLPFVQNHDTERDGSTLSYKDGPTNTLATEFLLAYGYGRPEVYSGFVFANKDDSPPADANGFVTDANCDNGWACTHRSRGVANLVDFHNYVGDAPVKNVYDDGVNLLAFSRGNKGWIAINNHSTPQTQTFQTGLTAGIYCDVIHGTFSDAPRGKTCSGPTVTVDAAGKATVTVPAKDSVAFSSGNRISKR